MTSDEIYERGYVMLPAVNLEKLKAENERLKAENARLQTLVNNAKDQFDDMVKICKGDQ